MTSSTTLPRTICRRSRQVAVLAFAVVLAGCGLSVAGHGSTSTSTAGGLPQTRTPSTSRGSHRRSSRRTASTVPGGTLRVLRVHSPDLGPDGIRTVSVYTPDVADPDSLPVVYWLTGSGGDPKYICNRHAATILDALFHHGVRPFVFACPSAVIHRQSDSEWANSVTGPDRLETFVTTWVRRAVEGSHPRAPGMRALAGFSMGGFASASIGLRHSTLYHQIVSVSGYFHLDDPSHVFGYTAATQDPHTPNLLVHRARGQRWLLEECDDDNEPLTAHAAEAFAPLLRAAGATVSLVRRPGRHGYPWAVRQLPLIATFLSAGWS